MSFDFSTLITDRSAEDLAKKATKAFYNASDLNRVTACMDYLDGELRRLGYESGYQRVRIERPSAPNGLPDGYTRLAYIESTGTQYILTDVVPNQDTEMEVVFSTRQSNQCGIAVCDFSWQQRGYGVWGNAAALGNMTAQNINLYDGEKHIVTVKNKRLSIDGQEKIAYSGENFACPCPLSVFALNRNGAIQEKTTMKLFSLSIDGEQYIPCRDPAGTVGLYNDTRQKFLKNAGTGAFQSGPEIIPDAPPPEPLDPYLWYDADAPTAPQMAQYLANVAALRAVFTLPEGTPQTPQSMALLTFAKANDIERVLQVVESALERMALTFVACGTATVGGDYL